MLTLNHDQIARLAYESWRQARILMHDTPPAPWADAKPHQRAMVMDVVRSLVRDPALNARKVHEAMVAERAAAGWSYGEYLDTVSRRSPLVTPWESLSPKYRAQQKLIYATVRHLLNPSGEE